MKKLFLFILSFSLLINFSCKKEAPKMDVPVSTISLSDQSISLLVGGKDTLKVVINPTDATDKNVVWTSSNSSIVSVNSIGVVSAVALGTDTITVSTIDGSKKSKCIVLVVSAPILVSSIAIPTSITITMGKVDTLNAVFTPTNTTNKNVSWKSSDTTVVKINSNGVASAVKVGNAVITATTVVGNKTATSNVSIVAAQIEPTSVSLNFTTLSVPVGSFTLLTATINPTNVSNNTITWSSSNTNIVIVSNTGAIYGVSAGSATITATTAVGNKTATCVITVNPASTSLLPNEIPIDSIGNIRTDLVSTTNARILYQKNLVNYLMYKKSSINKPNDTILNYRIHYLMPNNGDTIFNEYCIGFQPNVNYNRMDAVPDDQWILSGFKTPNKWGNYNLTYTCVRDNRTFTVVKNILTISQAAANTSISYKAICIDKDENYIKFKINGCILKFELTRKNMFNYTNYITWINNARAEKYIYPSCLTTVDFSAKTNNTTSM